MKNINICYLEAEKHNGYCLEIDYKSSTTKMYWQCENGHILLTTLQSVSKNHWCNICSINNQKKYKINDVILYLEKKYPGSKCFNDVFKNVNTKLDIECANAHKFSIKYSKILEGQWCKECSDDRKRLSMQHVLNFIEQNHCGGKCTDTVYKNSVTLLNFECEIGHPFKASFNNVKRGSWCLKCIGKDEVTIQDVYDFIDKYHPGGKCFNIVYIKANEKLKFQCAENHEPWDATYNNVVNQKTWCPICYIQSQTQNCKTELFCKSIFEKLFGLTFLKDRPKFLFNSKSNRTLELDGYCPELSLAFEYQGKQHYELVFSDNQQELEQQQYRDALKLKLCQENNVKLIIIPYWIRKNNLEKYITQQCIELNIAI